MQPGFHGAHGNPDDFGDVSVLETLIIRQDQHPFEEVRQAIDAGANQFLAFLGFNQTRTARVDGFRAGSINAAILPVRNLLSPGRDWPFDGVPGGAGRQSPGASLSYRARA